MYSLPINNILHHNNTLFTTDEPMLTHYNHPKSVVYIMVMLGVHFMSLEKCIMTCIHHYSIIQNIFITQKILCSTYSALSQSPTPGKLIILLFPGFCLLQNVLVCNHMVCSLFLASFICVLSI